MSNIFSKLLLDPIQKISPNMEQVFFEQQRDLFENTILKNLIWVGCPLFLLFSISDYFLHYDYLYTIWLLRFGFVCFCGLMIIIIKRRTFKKYFTFPYILMISYVSVVSNVFIYLNPNWEIKLKLIYSLHLIAVASFSVFPLSKSSIFYSLAVLYLPIFPILILYNQINDLIFHTLLILGFSVVIFFNRYIRLKNIVEEFLANEQLKIDAELGEQISQISHDIRSPLTALRVVSSQLDRKDVVEDLLKTALARLLNQMDELTHFASQMQISKRNISLVRFCDEVVDEINFIYKDVKVTKIYNIDILTNLNIDPVKIKRVIVNLVGNAVRAASCVDLKIQIEDTLKVYVFDNGPGFENTEDVFKKGKSYSGSTGMGLYFCKNILEAHGSKLEISRDGSITKVGFHIDR